MIKYCEYCGCASIESKEKCESCGAPFTIHTKKTISKPPEKIVDISRTIPDAYKPIRGLKPGRI